MPITPAEEKRADITPPIKKVARMYAGDNGKAKGDNMQWDIVTQFLPLVKSIACRMKIYFPETVELQDIYSIGVIGLVSAVQHYDVEKAKVFPAYAKIKIKGALLDELRKLDWMPRADRTDAKKYRKSVELLEQKYMREVSDEEICNELNITPDDNRRLKQLLKPRYQIPLDGSSSGGEEDGVSLHEVISDLTEQNGREISQNHELIDLVKAGLKELPEVPRKVLALYYLEELRLAEIAEVLDLTESRICQIHSQAIQTLRNLLKAKMNK